MSVYPSHFPRTQRSRFREIRQKLSEPKALFTALIIHWQFLPSLSLALSPHGMERLKNPWLEVIIPGRATIPWELSRSGSQIFDEILSVNIFILTWKLLPQRSQLNGLYPVCFLLWVMRFEDWLKAFPQTTHLWGFSPAKRRKRKRMNECYFPHCCPYNRARAGLMWVRL